MIQVENTHIIIAEAVHSKRGMQSNISHDLPFTIGQYNDPKRTGSEYKPYIEHKCSSQVNQEYNSVTIL
jgi:hypothetical protein